MGDDGDRGGDGDGAVGRVRVAPTAAMRAAARGAFPGRLRLGPLGADAYGAGRGTREVRVLEVRGYAAATGRGPEGLGMPRDEAEARLRATAAFAVEAWNAARDALDAEAAPRTGREPLVRDVDVRDALVALGRCDAASERVVREVLGRFAESLAGRLPAG